MQLKTSIFLTSVVAVASSIAHSSQVEALRSKQFASDLVTADKVTSQSAITFGHIAKTLHNLTCDINLMKKNLGEVL